MKKEEKRSFSSFFTMPPLTPVISMESRSENSEWDDEKSLYIHKSYPIRHTEKRSGKENSRSMKHYWGGLQSTHNSKPTVPQNQNILRNSTLLRRIFWFWFLIYFLTKDSHPWLKICRTFGTF